jgi:hypothetical protein
MKYDEGPLSDLPVRFRTRYDDASGRNPCRNNILWT